jgi:hypothetical protein
MYRQKLIDQRTDTSTMKDEKEKQVMLRGGYNGRRRVKEGEYG